MDAIELLTTRQSCANLSAPAPSKHDLDIILTAGNRVPDHGGLMPWHFSVLTDAGLDKLSDVFVRIAKNELMSEAKITKARNMPYRAPLLIIVSTQFQDHEKVPKIEQSIAAGCCCHAMQMAAYALGYGAIWRSGEFCYQPLVKQEFNIAASNDIVGFLYIGSLANNQKTKPNKPLENKVTYFK